MSNKITKPRSKFSMISNALLNDKAISLKAKGVYAFMYSKPDDFNFTIKSMSKMLLEGQRAIMMALQELKDAGWVMYIKNPDGTGEYHLSDEPKLDFSNQAIDPNCCNPNLDNSSLLKQQCINNKELNNNTDVSNTKEKAANEKSFADTLFPPEQLNSPLEEKEKSTPPPAPPPPKKEKEYSSEVKRCFKKCIVLFEEHLRPQNKAQQNNWLDTIDKLHNLDGIPFENIIEITTKARGDINFWAKNFLSLVKLRKTNKEGIKYIIVFSEQFKVRTPVVNQQAAQQLDKEMLEYLKM